MVSNVTRFVISMKLMILNSNSNKEMIFHCLQNSFKSIFYLKRNMEILISFSSSVEFEFVTRHTNKNSKKYSSQVI